MEGVEYDINFTDITLNEADGVFSEVNKIMLDEFPNNKWIIRSGVSITSSSGLGNMEIQCLWDHRIYILEYISSIEDLFYNPDIQVFSMWAQENGWKVPQPHADLIKSKRAFWKHFYDTLIIDSDYFDNIYGVRPQMKNDGEK